MKGKTLTILFGVLIASCLTKVAVREQLPQASVVSGDYLSADLRRVFDLSEAKFPLEFSTTVGETFNASQAFAEKHYDRLGLKQLNFVQTVHENFLAIVYDNTHVVFQALDHDGKGFGPYTHFDFVKFGSTLMCSDFSFNKDRFLMYVGCFDTASSSTNPGFMYIFTYDFKVMNVTNEVSVKQNDGYRIMNRLKMFIHSFPQDGAQANDDQLYMIVYDQGHTAHNRTKRSNMIRVFHNIQSGKLRFDTLVNTSMAGQTFDVVYDYYPYQNSLIATGRLTDVGEVIILAQCKLDLTDDKAICNPKFKATPVKYGKSIVYEGGKGGWYTEIDLDKKSISWFRLNGAFTSPNWNTHKLGELDNVDFPNGQDLWIRDLSMTEYIGTLTYSNKMHTLAGVTFMDWHTGATDYVSSYSATVYDKNWVLCHKYGPSQRIKLLRNQMELIVDAHYLDDGVNTLTLTATDADNSVSITTKVELMESIFERIYIQNNIGIIEVYSHTQVTIAIDPKDIQVGNGINVEVTTEDDKILKGIGYTSEPARILWKPHDIPQADWFFAANKAVALNPHRSLVWGSCEDTHSFPNAYTCTEEGRYALPRGENLSDKIKAHGDVIMMMSTNSTGTTVMFMNDDGEVVPHGFDGLALDFDFMATRTFYYAFIVFADRVEVWTVNRHDIEEFDHYETIDSNTFPGICPIAVSIPKDSQNRFSILSSCGMNGKYILRWGLTHDIPFHAIPLSSHISPVAFCDFGYEYLLRGHQDVYGLSSFDNFNKHTVPLDQLDASVAYEFTCLEDVDKAVYAAHGEQGKLWTLTVQQGNQGYAQGRRFPTQIEKVEAEFVKSYSFLGMPIHVVQNAGTTSLLQTFDTPRIRLMAGAVTSETDLTVTIRFYNKESEQTFVQIATVYPH
jgi:hypothetical protein